jgi:MFS transporter, DHA1 family, tetracycline resistance protein
MKIDLRTGLPLRKSPLLPIFLIVLVDILGMTIILPLLPFYAERMGASAFVVGLLVASYAACQLVAGPILGQISDHIGRRPVLIVSQIGTLAGFLILARAEVLWVVFLSRCIDGLTAGNLSIAQAYIADVTRPSERSKSFAVIGIAFGIGFLIGPAISGFLSTFSYSAPIYAAAALSFTSILCTYFLLPANPAIPEREEGELDSVSAAGKRVGVLDFGVYATYFRRPGLRLYLWLFFLFAFSFSTQVSGFALFAQRRYSFGPKEVGYVFAWAGFLGIILQGGLMGRLVKRFGDRKLVFSGFLAAAIGYALIGFTWDWRLLYAFTAIASYGTGVLRPAVTSLVTQHVSRREQGVVLGLTQSITSVCAIVAPILAGALINQGLLTVWALVAAGTCAVGIASSVPRALASEPAERTSAGQAK